MHILNGTAVACLIVEEVAQKIRARKRERLPGLAVILIGDHPASKTYVNAKKKRCKEAGILSFEYAYPSSIAQTELIETIEKLNHDPQIDGILLQLPLPPHIDKQKVLFAIDPNKDIDGFHPLNMGKLLLGDPTGFIPCTPLGIAELVLRNDLSFEGKEVVIVGRSSIVGRPLAELLSQNRKGFNATVTLAHSKSPHLHTLCKRADILVAAIGQPHFIKKDMVKKGVIAIDVGINKMADGTLRGDIDYETVKELSSYITPVPGGIGPMTIAMLLENTWRSFERVI